jgi:hypothetical protein
MCLRRLGVLNWMKYMPAPFWGIGSYFRAAQLCCASSEITHFRFKQGVILGHEALLFTLNLHLSDLVHRPASTYNNSNESGRSSESARGTTSQNPYSSQGNKLRSRHRTLVLEAVKPLQNYKNCSLARYHTLTLLPNWV